MKVPQRTRRGAQSQPSESKGFLEGQLLIAMPNMSDPRFARSVIYMCSHSSDGAMGLIINQRAPNLTFPLLLSQLNLVGTEAVDTLSADVLDKEVHIGGPVEKSRGFVLHTDDYTAKDATIELGDGICLTHTTDILKAIAHGNGPNRSILALGYAGWSPGQVESEIHANGWLNCPASRDIIFDTDLDQIYERALSSLGVDPSHLVSVAGRA
jgi:putative transcriptional regulator